MTGAGQAALRLREVAQMGFERCIIPAAGGAIPLSDFPSSLKVHAVRTLDEALQSIFD